MTPVNGVEDLTPQLIDLAARRTATRPWLYEDALQEAYIAAWARLRDGLSPGIAIHGAKQAAADVARGRRLTGSADRSTMGKVDAHRHAGVLVRTDALGEEYADEPADLKTLDEQAQIDLRDALRRAMERLTDDERALVWSIHFEGLTAAQAGAERGVSRQAIQQKLGRIYRDLREVIEP